MLFLHTSRIDVRWIEHCGDLDFIGGPCITTVEDADCPPTPDDDDFPTLDCPMINNEEDAVAHGTEALLQHHKLTKLLNRHCLN